MEAISNMIVSIASGLSTVMVNMIAGISVVIIVAILATAFLLCSNAITVDDIKNLFKRNK